MRVDRQVGPIGASPCELVSGKASRIFLSANGTDLVLVLTRQRGEEMLGHLTGPLQIDLSPGLLEFGARRLGLRSRFGKFRPERLDLSLPVGRGARTFRLVTPDSGGEERDPECDECRQPTAHRSPPVAERPSSLAGLERHRLHFPATTPNQQEPARSSAATCSAATPFSETSC